jgi:hypothetical protein
VRELLWHLHWRGVARSCVVFDFKHFDCGFVNSKCFVCAFFLRLSFCGKNYCQSCLYLYA